MSLGEVMEAYKATSAMYGRGATGGMGDRVDADDIQKFMDSVDDDNNKVLDFNEFVTLLGDMFIA